KPDASRAHAPRRGRGRLCGDAHAAHLLRSGLDRVQRQARVRRQERVRSGPPPQRGPAVSGIEAMTVATTPPFPFLVGTQRSGTTLLRSMLDSHPSIAIPPETWFLIPLARNRRRYETAGGFRSDRFVWDLRGNGALRKMGVSSAAL